MSLRAGHVSLNSAPPADGPEDEQEEEEEQEGGRGAGGVSQGAGQDPDHPEPGSATPGNRLLSAASAAAASLGLGGKQLQPNYAKGGRPSHRERRGRRGAVRPDSWGGVGAFVYGAWAVEADEAEGKMSGRRHPAEDEDEDEDEVRPAGGSKTTGCDPRGPGADRGPCSICDDTKQVAVELYPAEPHRPAARDEHELATSRSPLADRGRGLKGERGGSPGFAVEGEDFGLLSRVRVMRQIDRGLTRSFPAVLVLVVALFMAALYLLLRRSMFAERASAARASGDLHASATAFWAQQAQAQGQAEACVGSGPLPLWPSHAGPRLLHSADAPSLQAFVPAPGNRTGAVLVVLPGGGYT
jgi:hypothetical protein